MTTQHRYEHVVKQVANRIRHTAQVNARALQNDGRPMFSTKLTDAEQLEQYFAMTPESWQTLTTKYGRAAAGEYSLAMQKLARKRYGGGPAAVLVPPGTDTMIPPAIPQMAPGGTA